MDAFSTTSTTIVAAAVLILALCIGTAVLIAALKAPTDVTIRLGHHFGSRQPP
ncbi:hypothetical protein [Nocardioides sp. YIM 152315]|uniref:hypothetical protein n=1 Tax=Nocardioides sp. YIM 152315 TaxID=3031760 RepID=UPI0023DBCCD1|nr:hypothetical protein [Nocardioides sp. YIM 152315]MDF1603864.1 hypothetical protein [Nocardioides sp. YIM 152315]